MNLANKKAIVIIVEGITDQMILQSFLEQIIDPKKLYIKMMHGDILSDINVRLGPKAQIGKIMHDIVLERTKFTPENLLMIIQLTDTDGIFIPEENFEVDEKRTYPQKQRYVYDFDDNKVYFDSIKSKNEISKTWKMKKQNVDKLKNPYIYAKKVPYSLYFNSLNLEHVIFDELVNDKKEKVALNFIESLDYDYKLFKTFMKKKKIGSDFDSSWDQIANNVHWSQSFSNLIYLLKEIETYIS